MERGSWTRRIALFVLILVAGGIASLAVFHRQAGHNVAAPMVAIRPAAPVVAMEPVAPTVSQPVPQSEQRQALPSISAPDDETGFASIAESEVSQLQEGVTLDKWMDTRGKSERWEATKPEMLVAGPDEECLSLRRRDALPSGATMIRALYFHPPKVPSPIVFPTLSGSALFGTCTLAVVRVEVEASSPEFGRAMTQAISQQLTKVYGESISKKELQRAGLSGENVSRWVPHSEITSDYDAKPGLNPDAPGQLLQGPVVRVSAELPNIAALGNRSPAVRQTRPLKETVFRRVVEAAGVDAALSQRMENLYQVDTSLAGRLQAEAEEICKTRCVPEAMPKPTGNDWRQPLVPLLQDWFKALKTADAGHRAAGLLAADSLLATFGSIRPGDHFGAVQSSTAEQSKLRLALQEFGATFEPGYADGLYGYSGNWLDQAKDLDLDSEAGRLALLTWMSNGTGCQRAGSGNFREVISKGEALLTKKNEAPTAAQVHFMVGDAYSDMVAIAGGVDPNGAYASEDLGNEADSRAKALQHYRAGLGLDNMSDDAKDAWRQAWHLAAGLVPGTRYACFGD